MYFPTSEVDFEFNEPFCDNLGGLDMKDDKIYLAQSQCMTGPLPEPEPVAKEEGEDGVQSEACETP